MCVVKHQSILINNYKQIVTKHENDAEFLQMIAVHVHSQILTLTGLIPVTISNSIFEVTIIDTDGMLSSVP